MNEERKAFYNYMNPKMSEPKLSTDSLMLQIGILVANKQIQSDDWIILNKMREQIKNQNNFPDKILRSMQKKIQTIQNKYER